MFDASQPKSVVLPSGWTAANQARWQLVFARLLKTEGGFSNDRFDRGGATKYGISLRFLAIQGLLDLNKDGYADFDLNRDGRVDALDVALLTPANAEALYLRIFYIDSGFWNLPAPFDAALFDLGVNMGTNAAGRVLQRAVNTIVNKPLTVDGKLGPKTREALALGLGQGAVLAAFRSKAADRYREIVANDNTQRRFLNGWLKRASELGRVA